MRRPVKTLALVVLAGSAFAAVAADKEASTATGKRKLIVNGTATVHAKPDAAALTFAVTSTSDTGKAARDENDKQVKKLKDALTALGIKTLEVHAAPSAVGTSPSDSGFGPAPAPPPAPTKQVQTVFHVTVREKDVEKLRGLVTKLADTAVENGATGIGGDDSGIPFRLARRMGLAASGGPKIEWLAENVSEARKQAVKKAVADARESAQAAAGDAKLEVAEIRVTTDPSLRVRYNPDGSVVEAAAGQVAVRVDVEVVFLY
jgi:uncharacterized protein YggE